jgi:carbamoyltransferase
VDGEIIAAAQEERFTRKKNDESFPENAIRYCLQQGETRLAEIDFVVFYEKPFLKFERLLETFLAFAPKGFKFYRNALPVWIKDKLFVKSKIRKALMAIDPDWKYDGKNLLFTEHHQSHAASAFFPSPFSKAVVLTMDGVGEWVTTAVNIGEENQLREVKQINFPHSVGLLYSAFTQYLGYKVNCDEYKVMGLAPYGTPDFKKMIYEHLVDVKYDGSFRLNMRYFNFATGMTMVNQRFVELFNYPIRQPGGEIQQFHMNVAASIQCVTEEIILKLTNAIHQEFPYDALCLAGGVGLNCVANGRLLKESPFKKIWVQPAAGDAGGALGAALYVYYHFFKKERAVNDGSDTMKRSLLGPEFSVDEIEALLTQKNISCQRLPLWDFYKSLSLSISQGQVVGWFDGRMEFGPRALGSRSIIADSRNPQMQQKLNLKVKFRESYRPFAPAILESHLSHYFDLNMASPYMLFTGKLKKEQKTDLEIFEGLTGFAKLKQIPSTIPAVTHVDFSARVQTVNESNGNFYHLLTAFYELTGCPILINTSFNVMDEPIVCTPADAIRCFQCSDIDILAFPGIIIYKPQKDQIQETEKNETILQI